MPSTAKTACAALAKRQLVSAGADSLLYLWDLEDERLQLAPRGHANLVGCCAFSPDGRWIASGSMDRTVRLWEVERGQLCHTLHRHTNMVQQVRFSPDGRHLVSSSFDETYCLWEVATGELLARWPTANTTYLGLAIHPAGEFMLAGGRDHITRLVEIESGRVIMELHGHSRTVESISLCPAPADGGSTSEQLLVTAGHDETIRLWKLHASATAPGSATCLATLRAPGPLCRDGYHGCNRHQRGTASHIKALGGVEE